MLVCLSFLAFREDTAEQASERASLCHSSSSSDVFWQLAAESTENIRRSCIASLWIWSHVALYEEVRCSRDWCRICMRAV